MGAGEQTSYGILTVKGSFAVTLPASPSNIDVLPLVTARFKSDDVKSDRGYGAPRKPSLTIMSLRGMLPHNRTSTRTGECGDAVVSCEVVFIDGLFVKGYVNEKRSETSTNQFREGSLPYCLS